MTGSRGNTQLPPFPADALELSDYELGGLLLAWAIGSKAEQLGLPVDEVPEKFAGLIREHIPASEATTAKNAAVEKALHKAAGGDFETAGKLIREHLIHGSIEMMFLPIGIKRWEQVKDFGQRGAEEAKQTGARNRADVLKSAIKILEARTKRISTRQLSEQIEKDIGMPKNTVRGHLQKLKKEKQLEKYKRLIGSN